MCDFFKFRSCNAFQESSEHLSSNTVVSCKDTSSSSAFSNSLENSKSWFNCTSPFQNANSCDSKDTSSHFSLKAGSIPHLIYQMHKIADNDSSQSLSTIPELKPKSRGRTRSAILCRPILRSLSPNQKGNIGAVRLTNNQENDQDVNHPETPHRVNIRRCLSTNNVTLDQIGMMDDDKNTRYFGKFMILFQLLNITSCRS